MDLIWRSEKNIKFGDFCHFAPIAPNFLHAKIYPNKVIALLITRVIIKSIIIEITNTLIITIMIIIVVIIVTLLMEI